MAKVGDKIVVTRITTHNYNVGNSYILVEDQIYGGDIYYRAKDIYSSFVGNWISEDCFTVVEKSDQSKGEEKMANSLWKVTKVYVPKDGGASVSEANVVATSEEAAKIKSGFYTPVDGQDAERVTIKAEKRFDVVG